MCVLLIFDRIYRIYKINKTISHYSFLLILGSSLNPVYPVNPVKKIILVIPPFVHTHDQPAVRSLHQILFR